MGTMEAMSKVTPETLTDDLIAKEKRWLHDAKMARGIPSESQMRYERDLFVAKDRRYGEARRNAARQRVCDAINARK